MLRLLLLSFVLIVDGCVVSEPPLLESDIEADGVGFHMPPAMDVDDEVASPTDLPSEEPSELVDSEDGVSFPPDIIPDCPGAEIGDTDPDRDGLTTEQERRLGSNPCHHDSDGDGVTDSAEVRGGSDPWDPGDRIDAYVEIPTDEAWTVATVNFQLQLPATDIIFVLDSTGSMGRLLTSLSLRFSEIAHRLSFWVPDLNFGVAEFSDYPSHRIGTPGQDTAYHLATQSTSDLSLVQDGLTELSLRSGRDVPESGYEALYQALMGSGHDLHCDGVFDPEKDVAPFNSSPGDPFAGTAEDVNDPFVPDTGNLGGVGFRQDSMKIIVYGTDAPMRDPAAGDWAPGGCPFDATHDLVVDAAQALDARLIGVAMRANNPVLLQQMTRLAQDTDSTVTDGDSDRPIVLDWHDGDVVEQIVEKISHLIGGTYFDRLHVEVLHDPMELVQAVNPRQLNPWDPLTFRLELDAIGQMTDHWQTSRIVVGLYGDGELIAESWVMVGIPPRNRR